MIPRKTERAAPEPGGESFEVMDLGEPRYLTPVGPAKGVVRIVPADAAVISDLGEPLTAEQARVRHAQLGPPDPNRPLVPTRVELCSLPRWARVAYLARCARRALPAYRYFWPDAPAEHVEALVRAVDSAEMAARLGRSDPVTTPILEAVERAGTAAFHSVFSRWTAAAASNAAYTAASAAAPDDDPKLWEGPLPDDEAANLIFLSYGHDAHDPFRQTSSARLRPARSSGKETQLDRRHARPAQRVRSHVAGRFRTRMGQRVAHP